MKSLSSTRKGELFVFMAVLPGAFFPIIAKLSFQDIHPLYSLAWSSFFAAVFFSLIITHQKSWGEWKKKEAWRDIFFGSFLIGVCVFGLFFWGMEYTTAGNARIVSLSNALFSFLFFGLWHKDQYRHLHLLGALFMIFGLLFVLNPGKIAMQKGDIIILCAMLFAPLGNYFQQQARKKVSAAFHLFVRNVVGSVFFFIICFCFHFASPLSNVVSSVSFLLFNGFLGLGLAKLFSIESFHHLPVPKSISLGAIAPIFTLFFAFLILDEIPTIWQIGGLVPIIFGVFLLTKNESH